MLLYYSRLAYIHFTLLTFVNMTFPLKIINAILTIMYIVATAQGRVLIASRNPIVAHPLIDA